MSTISKVDVVEVDIYRYAAVSIRTIDQVHWKRRSLAQVTSGSTRDGRCDPSLFVGLSSHLLIMGCRYPHADFPKHRFYRRGGWRQVHSWVKRKTGREITSRSAQLGR